MGIMDEYKDYKIVIWCFLLAKVYNEQEFSADGGQDLTDYEIMVEINFDAILYI